MGFLGRHAGHQAIPDHSHFGRRPDRAGRHEACVVIARTFAATIVVEGVASYIPVPFDPTLVFGKARAPVVVSLNGHSYRSTTATMCGVTFVPLRRSNREAARVAAGETVNVTLALDKEARRVRPPDDLVAALEKAPGAWARWTALSFTQQREIAEAIDGAKRPETRTRRIAQVAARLGEGEA